MNGRKDRCPCASGADEVAPESWCCGADHNCSAALFTKLGSASAVILSDSDFACWLAGWLKLRAFDAASATSRSSERETPIAALRASHRRLQEMRRAVQHNFFKKNLRLVFITAELERLEL